MTHTFQHPKYYKELRKRNKLAESRQPVVGGQQTDQAIRDEASTEATSVRPGPGLKRQATSPELRATSVKQQAPGPDRSSKHQALPSKRQASSH